MAQDDQEPPQSHRGPRSVPVQSGVTASARPSLPPALIEGTLVDHFRIMRPLGRGGMGQVYLARDTRLGRRVALKVIRPERLGSEQATERFLFEARTTARFNHPHIVAIYAVGEHEGRPYVALEYVEGQDLRERMVERSLGQGEVQRIALAVAEALCEAHRHGILHRDLKPDNIILAQDGRARVLDFGLAQPLPADELAEIAFGEGAGPRAEPTGAEGERWGGPFGTPAYMAPEQWLDLKCSAAADVWALGVVLFELCAGRLPFDESTMRDQCRAVCGADPAPELSQLAEVPDELTVLVARCLDKDPERRPSPEAIADTLRELLLPRRRSLRGDDSPFRGLLPFAERHADRFFGREPEIAAFVERARLLPVLPVVGPAGVGKSSFVQAGVIPRLREQGRWTILQLRPGTRPFHSLAARLLRAEQSARASTVQSALSLPSAPSRPPPAPASSGRALAIDSAPSLADQDGPSQEQVLAEALFASPTQLSLRLRAIAELRATNVLLLVDQLEELFTLTASRASTATDASGGDDGADRSAAGLDDPDAMRRRFLEAICTAADDPDEPIRVAFTVRDDALGRLALGPDISEALRQVTLLRSLEAAQLRQVLTEPLRVAGYRYEDQRMVDEMVAEVRGERAVLPLLQFAAQLLWERRDERQRVLRRKAYDEMGGVAGALATHADGVLDGMSPPELRMARELMLRLVTPERTRRIVAQRRVLASLEASDDGDEPPHAEAEQVLARLIEARLITSTKRTAAATDRIFLELAHESLITGWSTLSRWVDESRDELSFLTEASQAAELWERRGRRPEELWQGDALSDARRALERCTTEVPSEIRAFLEASRHRQRSRERRRRRVIAAVVGASLLVATAAVLAALVIADKEQEARRQRDRAEQGKQVAEHQRAEALREAARAAAGQGQVLAARAKLRASLEIQDSALARGLWRQLAGNPLVFRRPLGSVSYDVDFSPDGETLAAASADGTTYLFDTRSAQVTLLRGHRDQVLSLAYAPDGRRLVTGSWGGELLLWDLGRQQVERVLVAKGPGSVRLAFRPDGEALAAAGMDGRVRLLSSLATEPRIQELSGHTDQVNAVCFSPDGHSLASVSGDGSARLWNADTGAHLAELRGHRGPLYAVAYSPDGALLATGGADQTIRLWDARTRQTVRSLSGHGDRVNDVAFSPDGAELASASQDHSVRLWTVATGSQRRVFEGPTGGVRAIAFSHDGSTIATSGYDRTVRLWNAHLEPPAAPELAPVDHATGVAISPDGALVASTGSDGTLRLWDTKTGQPHRTLRHTEALGVVRFSPDGRWLAVGDWAKSVILWELDDATHKIALDGHTATVRGLDFSPDGRLLATSGWDQQVRLWQVPSGRHQQTLRGHDGGVNDVRFRPDGAVLASASADHSIRLWDVQSAQQQQQLSADGVGVFGLSYSPDGRTLAASSTDGTLRLWDPATGRAELLGRHDGRVYWIEIGPRGRYLAAPCSDGTAYLWDLQSRGHLALRGHQGEVNTAAFDPSGALLATASDDGTVRLWNTADGRPAWHAPALLAGPPRLLSHRGWLALADPDGKPAAPPETKWRTALEQRTRFAAQPPATALLCLHTHEGGAELWDTRRDTKLAELPAEPPVEQVLAWSGGCAARTAQAVQLLQPSGRTMRLAVKGTPKLLGAGSTHLLAVVGSQVVIYDARGSERGRHPASMGITALAHLGDELALGYGDGNIEIVPLDPQAQRSTFAFEGVPSSAPVRMLAGPRGTLVVGYGNGLVGLWNRQDGAQLAVGRIHGRAVHLLLDGQHLHAATDLGSHLSWSLASFYQDRCDLLREIWAEVPVVWDTGQPVRRGPPTDHPCQRRPE